MSGFSQLNLKVKNCRSLTLSLVVIHLCASLAMLIAVVPLLIKLGGILLCAVSLCRGLYELVVSDQHITTLSCCPDEGWVQVFNHKGEALNVARINHYALLPFLLVLNFSDDQQCKHWFLVPRDGVSFNDFRRLKVVLAYHRTLTNLAKQNLVVQ